MTTLETLKAETQSAIESEIKDSIGDAFDALILFTILIAMAVMS